MFLSNKTKEETPPPPPPPAEKNKVVQTFGMKIKVFSQPGWASFYCIVYIITDKTNLFDCQTNQCVSFGSSV